MKGKVLVKSVEGEGSCFRVEIPVRTSNGDSIIIDKDQVHDVVDISDDVSCELSWPKKTRVLLVEDNAINQLVAMGILEDINLNCDLADNGRDCLEKMKIARDKESPYTLILMDCQMPDIDGYECTRRIRQGVVGSDYARVPIVAMTANAMEGDKERCIATGMDDYISKPIDPENLENILKRWLQKT